MTPNRRVGDTDQNPSVRDLLTQASQALRKAGVSDPVRDARLLMAASLGIDAMRITLCEHDTVDHPTHDRFAEMIGRRAKREPVSRIIGTRVFYDRTFKIGPDVLDPRPETECLIQAALEKPWARLLDIGTGSGCIAVTLLDQRPQASALATDVSSAALRIAMQNAAFNGVADRATFTVSNWFEAVEGKFDLIVSNPPYIRNDEFDDLAPEVVKFDPHLALFDAEDGLASYRELAQGAVDHLVDGGWIIVEIGPSQGQDVSMIFAQSGLTGINLIADLDGRDRIVLAQKTVAI